MNMARITTIRQEMPPCGAVRALGLPLNGLNFAIHCDSSTVLFECCARIESVARRWIVVVFVALLLACSPKPAPVHFLPRSMPGGWRRTGLRETPVSEAPDPVPRTEVTRLETATYEGPGNLEARVYELGSPEAGASLAQRWRPSADTVFFTAGSFFVVVKWQQADRTALRAFVRELETKLSPTHK
jgi:hypothetical protein